MSDPFEILGVPATFDLSDAQIERAYLTLASRSHPDAGVETGEQAMAVLNGAYKTLKNPETRANAMLAKLGGPSKEADTTLPEGFLMEIMETREELEDASRQGDAETVERGLGSARARREQIIQIVSEMFRALDAQADPASVGAIRAQLNAWRYVERLINQVGEATGR